MEKRPDTIIFFDEETRELFFSIWREMKEERELTEDLLEKIYIGEADGECKY